MRKETMKRKISPDPHDCIYCSKFSIPTCACCEGVVAETGESERSQLLPLLPNLSPTSASSPCQAPCPGNPHLATVLMNGDLWSVFVREGNDLAEFVAAVTAWRVHIVLEEEKRDAYRSFYSAFKKPRFFEKYSGSTIYKCGNCEDRSKQNLRGKNEG
ncbi:hypothetical protein MG293_010478 [Ovis ammon polii]|uniref:Uncharacterized protein n=1 Tax=Ovis ammon polii TaxID=230172 RepID=A0AAD4U5V6_OVIAM|nr:hypothetical protein MG293_010478 [Ovis ammon polii]